MIKDKLRIAVLGSRGYPSTYGGFETFVRRLAPYLVERGHKVSVYCRPGGHSIRWRSSTEDGVTQIFTPGLELKASSTLTFGFSAALDSICRRYDVILVLNVANGFFLPLLRMNDKAVAVNVDGIEWDRDKWSGLGKTIFRRGARSTALHADEIIADSRSIQSVWNTALGRKSVFIPYGADIVQRGSPVNIEKLGLMSGSYYLIVARLVPENNVQLILKAYSLLRGDHPLVIVGSGSSDKELRNIAALSGNAGNIRWLGHVSDQEVLMDLWSHCGVYLHGHSVGGTNPALLQAMGAGSPILAFDTPFNDEVLQNRWQLFDDDPASLCEKMTSLIEDQDSQARLRELGHVRIAESYLWDAVCGEYEALLARMANVRRG